MLTINIPSSPAQEKINILSNENEHILFTQPHPGPAMKTKTQILNLVAEIAVEGLNHTNITADERADLYEGLSTFLAKNESEAARYAATCIRECQRAQRDFLQRLAAGKGAA